MAFNWREIPLNEFTTEDNFTCAFPTGAADFLGQHQVQVTIGNYFKTLMQYDDGDNSPAIQDSVSLLSTQRCNIVLFRLAMCTSSSTQVMLNYPWMRCMTWLGGRGMPSPVECYIMPPVYVAPSSTGNVSGVDSSPWSIHWVCLLSSLHRRPPMARAGTTHLP